MRADSVERQRLEVQTRDLFGRVVAVETDAADHGRLPLAFVADQPAAGRERASECRSYECSGLHSQYPPSISATIEGKL